MIGVELFLWPPPPVRWSARWIAAPGAADRTNVLFRARTSITLDALPRTAPMLVAAETVYRIYINGTSAARGPARGTRAVNFYDGLDVAPLLRAGRNWIAVEVHSPNRPTYKAAPAQPALRLQCDALGLATDASWETQLAPDWRTDAPLYTYQIGFMEWRDLGREPAGWRLGADTSLWTPAGSTSAGAAIERKALLPRDVPPLAEWAYCPVDAPVMTRTPARYDAEGDVVARLMDEEEHVPLSPAVCLPLTEPWGGPAIVQPQPDGAGVCLILDFGREINGRLELDVEAPAGAILDIGYEEELQHGRLPLMHGAYAFADRYILREGRQTVGNAFAERGYRLVQIALRNFKRPIRIHRATAVDRRYPYVDRGSFTCSDAQLNAIWKICEETLRACTTDTFVDCPWRENTLYYNDLIVENVASLEAFGDARIVARCLRLAVSQLRPNGLIPTAVPAGLLDGLTPDQSADRLTLPASNLFLPCMLEEYLLYTGDRRLVDELLPVLRKMLGTVAEWEDADGLLTPPGQYWNFIDWSYPEPLDGLNTSTLNWIYVWALDVAARLMRRVGRDGEAPTLERRAAHTTAGIERRFWSDERRCYLEHLPGVTVKPLASQLSHAMALLSGRLPAERAGRALDALLDADLPAPDLYLQHLALRALTACGAADRALERIRRYWGPIALSGSPTVWECGVHTPGKAAFGNAGSLCHGFSTAPIDFLQTVVLGVRPLEPGFARCRIAPHSLGLEQARGRVPTPRGDLEIAWTRAGGATAATIRVPAGIALDLPSGRRIAAEALPREIRVSLKP